MLPGILNQLGAESLTHLKRLASNVTGGAGLDAAPEAGEDDDDEVPDLVENFDEASKDEKATEDVKISEGESLLSFCRHRALLLLIIESMSEIEDKDTSTKL